MRRGPRTSNSQGNSRQDHNEIPSVRTDVIKGKSNHVLTRIWGSGTLKCCFGEWELLQHLRKQWKSFKKLKIGLPWNKTVQLYCLRMGELLRVKYFSFER